MDKAVYDRNTKMAVEMLKNQLKGSADVNKVRTAAIQTLTNNVQFFRQLDPIKQAQMVEDVTDFYMRKNSAAGNQNMGNMGGAGQQKVFQLR